LCPYVVLRHKFVNRGIVHLPEMPYSPARS